MNSFLKYLITEDIYLVREDGDPAITDKDNSMDSGGLPVENLRNKTLVFIRPDNKNGHSDTDQQLLTKILQSVGEDPGDVLLFDLRDPGPHHAPLENFRMFNCRILGFLDQLPGQLSDLFPAQKYLIRSSGNFVSLMADPLDLIDSDRTRKKRLWEKLQDMYNLGINQKSP